MFNCLSIESEVEERQEFHQTQNFRAQQFLKEQQIKAASEYSKYLTTAAPQIVTQRREYLQPNRWKLHVAYGHHNNTLLRTLRLEDTSDGKLYQLNNLTEEDYRRIIVRECVKLNITYLLEEKNIIASLQHPILTPL
jgi:hypothetical protein